MHLTSTSSHSDRDAWLIHSSVSFHMTTNKEWFCEYENLNGGDVFTGEESTTKII